MKLGLIAVAFIASTTLAHAGVIVVAPTGIPSTIQGAVDVAVDGDVILVETGVYPSFVIRNKGVTVVANIGADVKINGAIRVGGTGATQTVVLSGLKSLGSPVASSAAMYGLRVSKCSGLVFAQDCVLTGAPPSGPMLASRSSLLVEDSQGVVLSNCVVTGGALQTDTFGYSGDAPEGARVTGSAVSLYDTTVVGTLAQDDLDDGDGGDGMVATNSSIYASGGNIRGGNGALISLSDGGPGGYGVRLLSGSNFTRLGTVCTGGAGGPPGGGLHVKHAGLAGQPIASFGGSTVTTWTGGARRLTAPALGRQGDTLPFVFTGAPNDTLVRVSSRVGIAWFVPNIGTQVPGHAASFRMQTLGVIGPSGSFDHSLLLGDLGAGVRARVTFYQGSHVESGSVTRLGAPRAVIQLHSSI